MPLLFSITKVPDLDPGDHGKTVFTVLLSNEGGDRNALSVHATGPGDSLGRLAVLLPGTSLARGTRQGHAPAAVSATRANRNPERFRDFRGDPSWAHQAKKSFKSRAQRTCSTWGAGSNGTANLGRAGLDAAALLEGSGEQWNSQPT